MFAFCGRGAIIGGCTVVQYWLDGEAACGVPFYGGPVTCVLVAAAIPRNGKLSPPPADRLACRSRNLGLKVQTV